MEVNPSPFVWRRPHQTPRPGSSGSWSTSCPSRGCDSPLPTRSSRRAVTVDGGASLDRATSQLYDPGRVPLPPSGSVSLSAASWFPPWWSSERPKHLNKIPSLGPDPDAGAWRLFGNRWPDSPLSDQERTASFEASLCKSVKWNDNHGTILGTSWGWWETLIAGGRTWKTSNNSKQVSGYPSFLFVFLVRLGDQFGSPSL